MADGGYSAYDAHLGGDPFEFGSLHNKNHSFGYSYPDSYSSSGGGGVDSPAKIAQQLMKYGLKQQRFQQQQQQQTIARLAPLLLAQNVSLASSNNRLMANLMDEQSAKFVGFGVIDVLNNREARLSCSFNEPIEQASVSRFSSLGRTRARTPHTGINNSFRTNHLSSPPDRLSGSSSLANTIARK